MIKKNLILHGKEDLDFSKGIFIFTDGAVRTDSTRPLGFRGGVGVVLYIDGKEVLTYRLANDNTTISRMEMTGILLGLKLAHKNKFTDKVNIVCDSQFAVKGFAEWLEGWKNNGWVTYNKTAVKNMDLWKYIDETMSVMDLDVNFIWIKGHNGNIGNERADVLATEAVETTNEQQ